MTCTRLYVCVALLIVPACLPQGLAQVTESAEGQSVAPGSAPVDTPVAPDGASTDEHVALAAAGGPTAASAPVAEPLSTEQLAQQGRDAMAAKDAAAAIKAYSALVEAEPNNTGALLSLAEAYTAAGNSLKAVETYNRCRKLSPGDWRPDFGLGTIYLQQNYPRLALRFLKDAKSLAPSQPQARGRVTYNLAHCYRGMYQYADAIREAREALALDSTNIDARRLLISLYVETKRVDDGLAEARATIESLRATVAKAPDDRASYDQLLQVLLMLRDMQTTRVTAQPDDPSLRLLLAQTLEDLAEVNRRIAWFGALEQLNTAAKHAPQDPEVLFALASLRYRMGQSAQAMEDLHAMRKIAPQDPRVADLLARLQAASSQPAGK